MDTIYVVVPYAPDSIVGYRAQRLMKDLLGDFEIRTFFKSKREAARSLKWRRWIEIGWEIWSIRSKLIYAFKPDKWASFAFLLGRIIGAKRMLDTGDVRYALARARGAVFWACLTERLFEVGNLYWMEKGATTRIRNAWRSEYVPSCGIENDQNGKTWARR